MPLYMDRQDALPFTFDNINAPLEEDFKQQVQALAGPPPRDVQGDYAPVQPSPAVAQLGTGGSPQDRPAGPRLPELVLDRGQYTASGQYGPDAQGDLAQAPVPAAPMQAPVPASAGTLWDAIGTTVGDAIGALPAPPTYDPNGQIARTAAGNRPADLGALSQYGNEVGAGVSQSVVPEPVRDASLDVGPVHVTGQDVASQVFNPMWLPGVGVGDLAASGATKLAADVAAPAIRTVAGKVGVMLPRAAEDLTQPVPAAANVGAASGADLARAAARSVNELVAPARNAPPVVQDAIRDYGNVAGPEAAQATVDAESLGARIRGVLGAKDADPQTWVQYEATGQFSANPTTAEQQLARDVQAFMQQRLQQGQAGGYIRGDQGANFLPHAYVNPPAAGGPGSASFNPAGSYTQARTIPTMADALRAGLQPVPISQAVQGYAEDTALSQAKVDLANTLKAAGPDVARPIAGARGPLPQGFRAVDDPSSGSPFHGWAFEPGTARAVSNLIGPSPVRSSDLGSAAMQGLSLAKQTLFSLSGFHTATEAMNGLFANGLRGPAVVGNMARAFVSPDFYQGIRYGGLADDFSRAAGDGVTGLAKPAGDVANVGNLGPVASQAVRSGVAGAGGFAGGYTDAKARGASDEDALRTGLALGGAGAILGPTAGKALNTALWERAVPTAKVLTYRIATEGGADGKAAADFVNNTFGGQNLSAVARSKGFTDLTRALVLAPDWTESTWKTVANTFAPTQTGTLTRNYVLSALAGMGFVGEAVNYALNGHTTDQNPAGHQGQIQVPADQKDSRGLPAYRYYSVLPGNLGQVADLASSTAGGLVPSASRPVRTLNLSAPLEYARNRVSPVASAAVEGLTNRDWRGQPINPPGTPPLRGLTNYGLQEAARIAPIGPSVLADELARGAPVPLALASAAGLKTTHGSASTPLIQQRDAFVADKWPDVERQLRADPAFRRLTPAQQQGTITSQRGQYSERVGENLGLPPRQTGLPPKYIGVTDPLRERAIDQAKAAVNAWRANPRTAPRPSGSEIATAARYVEAPQYQQAVKARTAQNAASRSTRQGAPLPIAP